VAAIMVAALLDALDGRIARLLGGTSKFGAELDSLSDFICFGVAPAMLVYLWSLHAIKGPGWVIAMIFAVCAALRLARFNTGIGDPDAPKWAGNFFTGVPSPAGGGLVLLPMMLSFEFGRDFFAHPLLNAPFALLIAYMMISKIPTFSFKQVRIPHRLVVPVLLAVGLIAALLATATWLTLAGFMISYLCTIPLSVRAYRRLSESAEPATDALSVIDGAAVDETAEAAAPVPEDASGKPTERT
jgi:CDP-diacylglycerol--serine O-phosphatidyltransferase